MKRIDFVVRDPYYPRLGSAFDLLVQKCHSLREMVIYINGDKFRDEADDVWKPAFYVLSGLAGVNMQICAPELDRTDRAWLNKLQQSVKSLRPDRRNFKYQGWDSFP